MQNSQQSPKRLSPGDSSLSSSTWNGFVDMYESKYRRTSISADPLHRPIPPILAGSSIALASLKQGQKAIAGYTPVRITSVKASKDLAYALPIYEVEAVDAVDENGDPTERHGNYAFTMSEGVTKSGGRVIISGVAIVAVPRNEVANDIAGMPVTEAVKQSYYMVPDKTLSDVTDVLLAPVGHFKLVSYHEAAVQVAGKAAGAKVFFLVDMGQRPTTFMVTSDGTMPESEEAAGVTTLSSSKAYTYYLTGGDENLKRIDVEKDDINYEVLVYNTTDAAIPAGELMVSYSTEYNRFVALAAGGGGDAGTGVGYLVRTGSSGLVSGVATDLDVYEASSENSYPTVTATTKRVVHNWSTDMGNFIPSNVNMIVVECSDGYSRPINIDNSWMSHTTLMQKWMANEYTQVINSSMLNGSWSTVSMSKSRFYGYGLSSLGNPSVVDVLRTGVYNVSVQWTAFSHNLDASIRIIDHNGVLQTQLFNSGTSANGGFMIQTGYTVTQTMLNSGGVTLGIEASYSGANLTSVTGWENFTFNVERVGD